MQASFALILVKIVSSPLKNLKEDFTVLKIKVVKINIRKNLRKLIFVLLKLSLEKAYSYNRLHL